MLVEFEDAHAVNEDDLSGRGFQLELPIDYRFLAAHHRAAGRPEARTYRLLSRGFDRYAGALTYLREIYLESEFAPWPHPSYVRVLRWD